MALHPGEQKRRFPEELPVTWDPIRRDMEQDEDWYRDLVEHSQDLLCAHDLEGRFLSVNPVPARLLGYSVEEMLRKPMRDFVDPQFHDEFDVYLREIALKGEARGLLAVITRSGEQRVWEYHNTLRTEGVGTPVVRGIAHDVTERMRAEKALRASHEHLLKTTHDQERTLRELTLFRTLLDQSNDAIKVIDPETLRFLDVNEKACTELGYTRDELLSMTVYDIDPNADERVIARVRQEWQDSGFAIMETVHRRKDGTTFPVEVNMRRVRLDREYSVSISRDITERKRAEEKLREFERVVENLEEMIAVVDRERRYVLMNPACLRYRGRTQEQVAGHLVAEVVGPEFYETVIKERLDECFRGKAVSFEVRHKFPQMGERDLAVTYLPIEGATGIDRVACVMRDITERKRAEERLREFERVVENLEEMIVVVNRDRRYLLANRAALRYRGMSREQLIGRHVTEMVQPELYEMTVKGKLDESFAGHIVSYESQSEYPGLGVRDLACTYLPIDSPTGVDRVACVLRDITENKQAEEALRASEREQHRIAEQLETERARLIEAQAVAKIGSWETELPSLDITWSEQTHRIFETDPSNFHPRRTGFVELIHPDDRAKVDAAFEASLEKGAPSKVEYRIVMADGRVKVLEEHWKVFQDGQGRPMRLVGTCQDITERKRAAAMLRESELRFRAVYERSPIGIALVDSRTGRFLQVNPKYCEITGRSEDELLQIDVGSITHPDDVWQGNEYLRELAEEKLANYEMEKRYLRPDGSVRWVRILVVPMWEKGETHRWHMGLAQDVTERRQSEEAIASLMQELCEAKKKLTEEKLYLEQEIDTELGFGEIVGQSKALQLVMEQVGKVAASDATVLLLGETGTGKELVARAIHRMSQRVNRSFVKLNCAAIPSGLLESELFGNEKGAFTGAVSRKIGRLELADKGTLFLDEIGEISLALQPKLLRVLQDQEFERLGGTQTLKVDFRLIAATNRELADLVRLSEFRSDLYYRLNVFPIRVPPLRERREDIPLLVEHFVQKFSRRMHKQITSIPRKTMDALIAWEWPGNVRELENFIERSVILTQGSVLVSPLSEMGPNAAVRKPVDETLEATEREHILRALRDSHGQIGGLRGAAMRLGLKRTTLQSKIKHLGINPRSGHP
jgi:PAS domain S-box-containing protein